MSATTTENERRAERAYRALLYFDHEENEREDAAVDLITNLLHMLDLQYGLEPHDALRIAWDHFTAEKVEP